MFIEFDPTAKKIVGWEPEADFSITKVTGTPKFVPAAGIFYPIYKDRVIKETRIDYYLNHQDFNIYNSLANPPLQVESLTPNICNVSQLGVIDPIKAGTCHIKVVGQTGERQSTIAITNSNNPVLGGSKAIEAVAGSLRKYLYDQQFAALDGIVPGQAAQQAGLYANGMLAGLNTSVSLGGSFGGVNPSCFARAQNKPGYPALPLDSLDLLLDSTAGSSAWKAWISPNHYLTWPGHTGPSINSSRIILMGEICVNYSATPWAGSIVKFLPLDYQNYAPSTQDSNPNVGGFSDAYGSFFAVWSRNFNTYIGAGGTDSASLRRWVTPVMYLEGFGYAADHPLTPYQRKHSDGTMANGNDSGSPAWMNINGDLVIFGHTASLHAIAGASYHRYTSEISQAMNDLATMNNHPNAGNFAVSYVDLSMFTYYPTD